MLDDDGVKGSREPGDEGSRGTERANVEGLSSLRDRRVLVVEDDPHSLAAMRRVLRVLGAEVETASSLESAQKFVEAEPAFDAAVVDFVLEDDDGTALFTQLRAGEAPCAAVMVTGHHQEEYRQRAIEAGADDVLQKPFEVTDFVAAVERAVRRSDHWRARLRPTDAPEQPVGVHAFPEEFSRDAAVLSNDTEKRIQRAVTAVPAVDVDVCTDRLTERGGLSVREREVLRLVLRGLSNPEIARELGYKPRTIKYYASSVYRKLDINGRTQLLKLLVEDVG